MQSGFCWQSFMKSISAPAWLSIIKSIKKIKSIFLQLLIAPLACQPLQISAKNRDKASHSSES